MNSRSVILLENTDKALCHLRRGHNEVIYSLSKSTNVQIDVCTNTDERTIKRMEVIINNNSLNNSTPEHDDEQSQSLFSDIYSYLSTSVFGVLFGYFFKGIYQHAGSIMKAVQQTNERCCDGKENGCVSCDPYYIPELCESGKWCPIFVMEVILWALMLMFMGGFVYGICCCGICRDCCSC